MTTNPALTQLLADFKAGFKQRAAPERVAMMEGATAGLRASGIETRALQVGDAAPDVTLPTLFAVAATASMTFPLYGEHFY